MLVRSLPPGSDRSEQRLDEVREARRVQARHRVNCLLRAPDEQDRKITGTPEEYRALAARVGDDGAVKHTVDEIDAIAWRKLLAKVSIANRVLHLGFPFAPVLSPDLPTPAQQEAAA